MDILIYHKLNTFSLCFDFCGELIIPKIWCCFYVKASIKLYCFKNQALSPALLVGKLSKELIQSVTHKIRVYLEFFIKYKTD